MARVNAQPEEALLRAVIDMSRLFGLMAAHFRPAQVRPGKWITAVQGDGKGFPDLVIAGEFDHIFPELKSEVGRLSPEQKRWGKILGDRFRVWRPSDLHSGRIEKELRALRSVRETR